MFSALRSSDRELPFLPVAIRPTAFSQNRILTNRFIRHAECNRRVVERENERRLLHIKSLPSDET